MPLAVCATPIGNLDDVTLRVLEELRNADVVLAEDTRHTKILLERHEIRARLLSFHEHNEAARVGEMLPRLAAGERVALVSDAGLPGISDPGALLVRAALEAGAAVTVLPGASAVETALVASGLVSERYAFVGFLPRRQAELARLWEELSRWRWPVVAFESPKRLPGSLRSLAQAFPEQDVVVCREMTKRFEEIVRGAATDVAERFSVPPKGEITLVLGPGKGDQDGESRAVAALGAVADLVAAGAPRKAAVEVVSRLLELSRNDLYRRSVDRRS